MATRPDFATPFASLLRPLTPAEARTLAAVLTREADLAATTPKEGGHATRTFQLPDHTSEAAFHQNPRHHKE